MKTNIFPLGATASKAPKEKVISLWRLFNYGVLLFTVTVIGSINYDQWRKTDVVKRLYDTPRKRPRAHIPYGFAPIDDLMGINVSLS